MRGVALLVVCSTFQMSGIGFSAELKVENYPDSGGVQFKYDVLPDGSRQGPFNEFYPDGKPKVRGAYLKNLKNGVWVTFDEKGVVLSSQSYKKDLLDGPTLWNFPNGKPQTKLTYKAGELAGPILVTDAKGRPLYRLTYPRSRDTVMKAIASLSTPARPAPVFTAQPSLTPPYKAGVLDADTCETALKYVKLYRFLSGLNINNIVVDPGFSAKCGAAAVLLHRIGHLTHEPEKPADFPDDLYKDGAWGCGHSNLDQGNDTVFGSIDDYMNDSDESNVKAVGHRQWILHPAMQKIGFGYADHFNAMYTLDAGTHASPDYSYVTYPGEGYYPTTMLSRGCAWSIHLSSHWMMDASAKVSIHELDEHFAPMEPEVPAHMVGLTTMRMADWHVLVFRPELPKAVDARYVVELSGVQMNGQPQNLSYLVDLFDPNAVSASTQPAK